MPLPETDVLDLSFFWASSLLRALTARSIARATGCREDSVAFTGALLSDIAIPTLVQLWTEFYEPVIHRWQDATSKSSAIAFCNCGRYCLIGRPSVMNPTCLMLATSTR